MAEIKDWKSNTAYDTELMQIPHYQVHPEMMPFVGLNYEKYRILQVGESHYIGQIASANEDSFPITHFSKWLSDHCDEIYQYPEESEGSWGEWYYTRYVIRRYLTIRTNGNYGIFNNVLRSFRTVTSLQNVNSDAIINDDYHCFAFMNYFQMPALYDGISFWKSLKMSAYKVGYPDMAGKLYDEVSKVSTETLDKVIDILQPKVIVFTSSAAAKEYRRSGKYSKDKRLIITTHPTCPWWNRKHGSDKLSGHERFEVQLKNILIFDI